LPASSEARLAAAGSVGLAATGSVGLAATGFSGEAEVNVGSGFTVGGSWDWHPDRITVRMARAANNRRQWEIESFTVVALNIISISSLLIKGSDLSFGYYIAATPAFNERQQRVCINLNILALWSPVIHNPMIYPSTTRYEHTPTTSIAIKISTFVDSRSTKHIGSLPCSVLFVDRNSATQGRHKKD
jgi:hypothetical protein